MLCATMETYGWLMDHLKMKGEWNFVLTITGALSVMMSGTILMLV